MDSEMNKTTLAQILVERAKDYCDEDYCIDPLKLAQVLLSVGLVEKPAGAEVIFVSGNKAREVAEQFVALAENHNLDDMMITTREAYSDLRMAQKNYEYCKEKVEELKRVVEKQNQTKIEFAKAYVKLRETLAKQICEALEENAQKICEAGTEHVYEVVMKDEIRQIIEGTIDVEVE